MTVFGILGLLLSVLALGIGWTRTAGSRFALMGLLLVAHVAASLYYYEYSMRVIADAWSYYFDPFNLANRPFGLSTVLVFKIIHFMKVTLGASYLDSFLVFQSFGFAGVMILARIFDEIETNIGVPNPRGYLALLFLPSVNFWTAAIGKDAPLFLAISLCVWAMLNLRKRFLYFCLALTIMVLFRAHIALIAAAALAMAAFFDSSASLGRKLGLLTIAVVAIWFALGPVKSTLNVDVTSVSAVSQFLDANNKIYANVAGTTSIGHASFFFRIFSLLFRPFFIDASGILGLVASAENVGVVLGLLYTLFHWRDLMLAMRRVLFVRFCLIFAFVILVSLTVVYYNVGLGLRQRVMAYPMIFSALVTLWAMRAKDAPARVRPQAPRGLMPENNPHRAVPEL